MGKNSQTVYIIDDDGPIRSSLQRFVESEGLQCKGFSSAADFMAICNDDLRGCVLLDIHMPEMSGLELQRWLIDKHINIPVIFLTGTGDIPLSSQAFRTGAVDFLEKPFDIDILLERIHEALRLDLEQWHARYRRKQLNEIFSRLSPREKEVLKWIYAGYSSKETAISMGISNRTVEVHRAHIMEKMQVRSLADLICIAMELNL